MSTPEERLRQKAEALEARRVASNRQAQEDDARRSANLQERARTASTEAETWKRRVGELVDATRRLIPWKINQDIGRQETGFHLRVGTAEIQLELRQDGWHVTRVTDSLHPSTGLPTNPAGIREQILERMVAQGLEDLYEGRVEPAPER